MFFNPYSVCESAADWAKLATRIWAWGVCPRLQQRVDVFLKSLAILFNFFQIIGGNIIQLFSIIIGNIIQLFQIIGNITQLMR